MWQCSSPWAVGSGQRAAGSTELVAGGQLQAWRTSSVLLTATDTISSSGSACTVLHRPACL